MSAGHTIDGPAIIVDKNRCEALLFCSRGIQTQHGYDLTEPTVVASVVSVVARLPGVIKHLVISAGNSLESKHDWLGFAS